MDFPLFFIDHMGNRLLMAIVAILHVLINHPFAVGGYPLVFMIEWWVHRRKSKELDELAYKITFVFFIVTTTIGALTGVGIWLTSSLIAPFAIGSLLRVFFGAWATEWLVFITELVLVLAYFLTWKKWDEGSKKIAHLGLGFLLAFFSWVTMAIITAILGFMMDPGDWKDPGVVFAVNYWSAIFNPIYLPQLAFRTFYSTVTGGLLVWLLLFFFTEKNSKLRASAVRRVSIWILTWLPFSILAAAWYWNVIPDFMQKNVDVALLGKNFARWHNKFLWVEGGLIASVFLTAVWGAWKPKFVPAIALIIPCFFGLWILGHFERVREFIRKPYVIGGYMYANGVRKSELSILQRDGMLTYATYVKHREVTDSNKIEAGQDVFMIACSRCHAASGMNGVTNKFYGMYGKEWDAGAMKIFLKNMNKTHPYMPPFPGNEKEMEALIQFILNLKEHPRTIHGMQHDGIPLPDKSKT